jgi:hypothetical protein
VKVTISCVTCHKQFSAECYDYSDCETLAIQAGWVYDYARDVVYCGKDCHSGKTMAQKKSAKDIPNPLLDEWSKVAIYGKGRGRNSLDDIGRDFISEWKAREKFTILYSWAIPNESALEAIAELNQPIIEIGAGTGYWASLLSQMGVDIICFDEKPPGENVNNSYRHKVTYHDVMEGGPDKVKEYSNRALFLCWAPYDTSMAYDCLNNYSGDTVIFIGEGIGGCTADDSFFEKVNAEFEENQRIRIPQWDGIHDRLTIYRRKSTQK